MKKIISCLFLSILMLVVTACSNNKQADENTLGQSSQAQTEQVESSETQTEEKETDMQNNEKRVASDNAQMQTEDLSMPTRVLEEGTRINMHFGDTVIPGTLNDSETAQALIKMFPYTVHMSYYTHDFCGIMQDELPYTELGSEMFTMKGNDIFHNYFDTVNANIRIAVEHKADEREMGQGSRENSKESSRAGRTSPPETGKTAKDTAEKARSTGKEIKQIKQPVKGR